VLARHGETVANVEGRWQGQSDSPLTERGRQQAAKLADALALELDPDPVAAVYSSDLGRALATATIVAAPHGLPVTPDARLREIDTGDWTRRLGADLRRDQPDAVATWRTRPASMRLPGGETLAEVQARALAFFAATLGQHGGGTVVVLAHGTINQCILVQAMRRPVTELWLAERIDNCQISRLEWTVGDCLRLVELSDVRHLADTGSLKGWRTTDTEAGESAA